MHRLAGKNKYSMVASWKVDVRKLEMKSSGFDMGFKSLEKALLNSGRYPRLPISEKTAAH